MNKRLLNLLVGVVLGGAIIGTMSVAHSESTGNAEADARIANMKKMGANLGAIAKVAKGEMAYSEALNDNAKEVAALAANAPKWFPKGSGVEASRAKPDIWDDANKADFQQKIANLQAASLQLVSAVQTGDQAKIGAALKETGGACGACHKMYRKPKE